MATGLGAQAGHPRRRLPGRGEGQADPLRAGLLHPVVFDLPEGVTAEVDKVSRTEDSLPTIGLTLRGVDRETAGRDRGEDPRAAAAGALQGQGHQVRRGAHSPQGRQDRDGLGTAATSSGCGKSHRPGRTEETPCRRLEHASRGRTASGASWPAPPSVRGSPSTRASSTSTPRWWTTRPAGRWPSPPASSKELKGKDEGDKKADAKRVGKLIAEKCQGGQGRRRWCSTATASPTTAASPRWRRRAREAGLKF